jgi:leucyl/phenylalanyl-tRNA--protein transferase
LRQTINSQRYTVSFDLHFREVIVSCAETPRGDQEGTWITSDMIEAYTKLHELGYAHSVEVFHDGILTGGLYGISIGKIFFGESMFHRKRDASKVALYHLVKRLKEWDFALIDAQQKTQHIRRLGGRAIPRSEFLEILGNAIKMETTKGPWTY